MLSAEKWWGVISNYNERIFPFQMIVLFIGILIIGYLFLKPEGKGNAVLKGYFAFCNFWIGIVFFNHLGKSFPVPLRQIQGAVFILIAFLFVVDIFLKKTVFRFPEDGKSRMVTLGLLLLVLIYPVVGLLAGRSVNQLIYPGTLPCATSALALVLLAASVQTANKPIYFLLLVWAVPFPPLIQIPKYHVYEDAIMFLVGIYGFAVMLVHMLRKRSSQNLRRYKQIFNFLNDCVFATSSSDYVPNIVPIHSKHLLPGNKVLISDQFMNKTKQNIMNNPNGTLVIKESNRLFKISGRCKYKTSGFLYRMAVKGVQKYAREHAKNKKISLTCKGIVLMKVKNAEIEAIDGKE